MAEMRPGEEFLGGFLSSLNNNLEEGRKRNQLTPEIRLKLMGMESEGTIEKGKFANDPQGAIQYIGQLLQGGRSPMDQYQATPQQGIDYRPAIIGKAPILKDILTRPIRNAGEATNLTNTFGERERASFYTPKGFDLESGLPVTFDAADNQWYKGGEKVEAKEVSRLLSNTAQNVPDAEMNKLSLINTRLSQLKSFQDNFDPKSWGLINGSLNKTIAFYTDSDPERAQQYKNLYDVVADVVHERYGANLTSNELNQRVDSIMSKYQSPTAVQAFVKIQEARSKTEKNNRIKMLKSQRYIGTDEIAEGGASEFPKAPPKQPGATSKGTKYRIVQ